MDKKTFEATLNIFRSEFTRLHEVVEAIPKTPEDLQKLLTELRDSSRDRSEHF